MKVSVVVPIYNEEANIRRLAEEFESVAAALPGMEVIFVDDGSDDGTADALTDARSRFAWLRDVRMPRRSGQSCAMLTGLRQASGDVLVTIDGDLQNNPADIPSLVSGLADCDVVCGYRRRRRDTWSRRAGSRLAGMVRRWVTRDGVRDTGCSLKAFRRECLADLPPVDGVHRFMPAYFGLKKAPVRRI